MAYSADWINKTVTIPASDMAVISGNDYNLDMADFHKEIRRLEWEFVDGLWAEQILDHTIAKINFAGADYAPFDEIINGYEIKFEAGVERVNLLGSNNNLVDVLIYTGVSVVPSNSAGLQVVATGSGVTAQDKIDIANLSRDTILGTESFP